MGSTRNARTRLSRTWWRNHWLLVALLLVATTATVRPGTLMSVSAAGASSGVTITLTGTGFNATAANNSVTFSPASGAPSITVTASGAATVDAAKGIRRLAVQVPSGLPTGRADLRVTNTVTGETATGAGIEIVAISLPGTASAAPGSAGVAVRIVGTSNAAFTATTRPSFGAGITVVSVALESPAALVATVNIAQNAALGPRNVALTAPTQVLLAPGAFQVSVAPPNRPPTANANGPYNGTVNQSVAFTSAGTEDPDKDLLTYAWSFGDGGSSADADPQHTYSAAGQYTASLTVTDGRGGSATATAAVVIAEPNRPPTISSAPNTSARDHHEYRYQVVATDPDGESVTVVLRQAPAGMTIDQAGLITWTPTAAQIGPQAVVVEGSDGRGGVSTQAFDVLVRDLAAPVVNVAGPSAATASTSVDVSASAKDNVAVVHLSVFVDGLLLAETTSATHNFSFSAPAEAGTTVVVRAVARDAAGNEGESTASIPVTLAADVTPPVIEQILVPVQASPGERFTARAIVSDDRGVADVRFTLGSGDPITTAPPFETPLTVPAGAAPGTSILVAVRARDAAGNESSGSASIAIVSAPDTTAPAPVSLDGPASASPGDAVNLTATALDNVGVARVVFFRDGVAVGEATEAPYRLQTTIPAGATVGSAVRFDLEAFDFAGNRASAAPRTVTVVAQAATFSLARTRSLDGVGHPLGAVTVVERGPRGERTHLSDARTGFVALGQGAGHHAWRFEKAGYLPVWRHQALVQDQIGVVANPWLARRHDVSSIMSPLGGGEAADAARHVVVSANGGAFATATDATVTALTAQSLPGALPVGWSPVQAFWFELSTEPNAPLSAAVTLWGPIGGDDRAALVRWDADQLRWIVAALLGNAGPTANLSLPGSGAYAVVVADSGALAPPSPLAGQQLRASDGEWPDVATLLAAGQVVPAVSAASTRPDDVTATATVTVTHGGALPSGLAFPVALRERYTVPTGLAPLVPPSDLFVAAYRRAIGPGATTPATDSNRLHAVFPVRPRVLLGPEALTEARVAMDAFAAFPASTVALRPGGSEATAGAIRILTGTGDVGDAALAELAALDADDLGAFTGGAGSVVHAFALDISGLATGRRARVRFDALEANTFFVLARVLGDGPLKGLEPVERFASAADGTLTSLDEALSDGLPGVTGSGVYVLVRVNGAHGIVVVTTRDAQGTPAAGLAARLAGQPWLAFSGLDGRARLVAPAGSADVVVTDASTGSEATLAVTVSDPATAITADLSARPSGPRVAFVDPPAGASNVRTVTPITVTFTRPIRASSLGLDGVRLLDAGGTPIRAAVTVNLSNTIVTLLPDVPLAFGASYTVALSATIADPAGVVIEGTRQFTFTTADESVRGPGAQLISYAPGHPATPCAAVPGFDPADREISCITGTQGIADADVPVVLVNDTTGATATVRSDEDGSFTNFLRAGEDDFISATFLNANGTRITVPLSRQIFPDGRVALFAGGGVLEVSAVGGSMQVVVEPGAIPTKTTFTLETIEGPTLTEGLRNTAPVDGRALGRALRLAVSGDRLKQPPKVSFTVSLQELGAQPGDKPEDGTYALAVPTLVDGEVSYMVIDKMTYADGRLVTASPPFPGADPSQGPEGAFEVATFIFTATDPLGSFVDELVMLPITMALNSGPVIFTGKVLEQPVDAQRRPRSIPRALGGALVTARPVGLDPFNRDRPGRLDPGAIYAMSDRTGKYSILTPRPPFGELGFIVTAAHPIRIGARVIETAFSASSFFAALVQQDLVFAVPAAGVPDPSPPRVSPSHAPFRPPPGGSATLRVLATHGSALPDVDVTVASVASLVAGVPAVVSDITITEQQPESAGAFAVRQSFLIHSTVAARVVLEITASTTDRSRRVSYAIDFGGIDPVASNPPNPDPDDTTAPFVLQAEPSDGSRGLAPGQPIVLRFSEAIDRTILDQPEAILLSNEGGTLPLVPVLRLSADQRELSIVFHNLAPDTPHTLTVGPEVQDLANPPNRLDQDRSTSSTREAFTLRFRTAPAITGTLPGMEYGGGAITRGIYAYALERHGAQDGSLVVFDLSHPENPVRVAELSTPAFPRDLTLVPRFSFVRLPGAPIETKDLLAIVGGELGGGVGDVVGGVALVGGGQFLWLVDISNPTAPVRIASTLLSIGPTTAVTRVVSSPPALAYLESSADAQTISLLNLQALILSNFLQPSEFPAAGTAGNDINGDGDYVDAGEELPLPCRCPGEIGSRVLSFRVPDTNQRINDFSFDWPNRHLSVALSAGKRLNPATGLPSTTDVPPAYRTLFSGGLNLNPSSFTEPIRAAFPFPGTEVKRVFPLFGVPVQSGGQDVVVNLAVVSLSTPPSAGTGPNEAALGVLDITDPLAPRLVQTIRIPPEHGAVHSIVPRHDGMLVLSAAHDILLLDPLRLTVDPQGETRHPALVGTVRQAGQGARTFSADPAGLNVTSHGGKNTVIQTAPALQFVSFAQPDALNPASLVDAPWPLVQQRLALMRPQGFLAPARYRTVAGVINSSLSPASGAAHYHVMVDAPGSIGPTLDIALESLNHSGHPLRSRGMSFPPVRAVSSQTAVDLDQAPVVACEPAARPLKAYRLSSNPADPLYNQYLSIPFALTYESISVAELTALAAELDRVILWSGHFLRASIEPALAGNTAIGRFAGAVDDEQLVIQPGASAVAATLPADYIMGPNPPPATGAVRAPGTMGTVAAHSGEMRIDTVDLVLPGRRLPIEFRRSIGGQDLHDGPFGRGWDFTYNQRLVELRPELFPLGLKMPLVQRGATSSETADVRDVMFHTGMGRTLLFKYAGADAPDGFSEDPLADELGWLDDDKVAAFYLPPAGVFDMLVKFPDGRFARLSPHGTQYWYAADGRLEKIQDRYAPNRLTLVHNDRGELIQVRDELDRAVDIGYWRAQNDLLFRDGIDERTTLAAQRNKIRRLKDYTGRDIRFSYSGLGLLETREGPEVTTVREDGVRGRQVTTYFYRDCSAPQTSAASIVGVTSGSAGGAPMFVADQVGGAARDVITRGSVPSGSTSISAPLSNTAAAVDGATATVVSPDARSTTFTFDAFARATNIAVGDVATSYQYDDNGLLSKVTKPEGNSIEYIYDESHPNIRSRGNLREVIRRPDAVRGGDTYRATLRYDEKYNLPSGEQRDFNGNVITITLTPGARDIERVLYQTGEADHFTFNAFGQRLTATSADGVELSTSYDDATGFKRDDRRGAERIEYSYSGATGARGLPSSLRDARNVATTELVWNERDELVSMTRAGLAVTRGYDKSGRVTTLATTVDDGKRLVEDRDYNEIGFLEKLTLLSIEVDGGRADLVTDYEPDEAHRIRRVTAPGGQPQTFFYDALGRVERTELGPRVHRYTYDDNGNRLTVSVGGAVTTYGYDGHDRLLTVTDAEQGVTTYTYDGNNNTRSVVVEDPNFGILTDLTIHVDARDRRSRSVLVGDQGESETTYDYDGGARTTTVTDPEGAVTTITYDAAGRLQTMTDPTRSVTFGRDANGNVLTMTSREGTRTFIDSFGYDPLDRVETHSDLRGPIATFRRRLDGAVVEETDAASSVHLQSFTLLGELESRTRANGVAVQRAFDEARRAASLKDTQDNTLTYSYDDVFRPTGLEHPDGTSTIYADFDARGMPRHVTLPGSATVEVTMDRERRPLTIDVSGLSSPLTFGYDALGRVRTATYPGGDAAFGYDGLGMLRSAAYHQHLTRFEVGQRTDLAGNRVEVEYPSGVRMTEGRDGAGRLGTLGMLADQVVTSTSYDAADLVGERQLGGGITATMKYDERKRPLVRRYVDASGTPLVDVRYEYDAVDNPLAQQFLHRAGRVDFFTYDAGHRLLRADLGARPALAEQTARPFPDFATAVPGSWAPGLFARTWAYDTTDVMTGAAEINPDLLVNLPFEPVRNGVDARRHTGGLDGGFSRSRDARGNTQRARLWVRVPESSAPVAMGATLHHDGQGRLLTVERDDGAVVENAYRHDGLRFSRTVSCPTQPPAGCVPSKTSFVYDPQGRLLEEYDVTNSPSLKGRYYYGDDFDELIAGDVRTANGLERVYYLTDAQGSVLALADSTGQVIERVIYDAWGQPRIERADRRAPRVSRILSDGGDLIVELSERVLPPAAGPAPATGLVSSFAALASAFTVRVDGAVANGTFQYEERLPGFALGTAIRFRPTLPLSGTIELSTRRGGLVDESNNGVPDESFTFAYSAAPGVLVSQVIPGGTAPEVLGRSAIDSPFLFHGQVFDYDTGLVYMRSRYYEPSTGLFLEPDPLAYQDSPNPYAAFVNNPVRYTDPSGAAVRVPRGTNVQVSKSTISTVNPSGRGFGPEQPSIIIDPDLSGGPTAKLPDSPGQQAGVSGQSLANAVGPTTGNNTGRNAGTDGLLDEIDDGAQPFIFTSPPGVRQIGFGANGGVFEIEGTNLAFKILNAQGDLSPGELAAMRRGHETLSGLRIRRDEHEMNFPIIEGVHDRGDFSVGGQRIDAQVVVFERIDGFRDIDPVISRGVVDNGSINGGIERSQLAKNQQQFLEDVHVTINMARGASPGGAKHMDSPQYGLAHEPRAGYETFWGVDIPALHSSSQAEAVLRELRAHFRVSRITQRGN